ncbi:hypothetical protein BV210_13795 [Halorientalis sp. IM1011]|uniref:hypothetical protein n=1 Tax=Halorientalis sp. IM1011 TaxID=1932360 RepID=UPI00097CD4B1|nr:hypothetical protein [Halorientalis sp. IM1011]AQL43710.1 hypothetical protein BV210_13795 [Halorientalis sp. IM1011]
MSPLVPTDPTLLVPSIDRPTLGTPAVLASYILLALLLLARGMKRSWLGGRNADEPDPDADRDAEEPLAERHEETPS